MAIGTIAGMAIVLPMIIATVRYRTRWSQLLGAVMLSLTLTGHARASSGTEAASFLDIPVGGGPAAMGSAYSALATDAYAPTWNPGGLGMADTTQFSAQHLSYLESIHYEYFSFVHPWEGRSVGASVQYLGSGDIAGTDGSGNSIGDFSSHFAAYSLAYGQLVTSSLSLGLTGKFIDAKISDVSAHAYAFDLGSLYRVRENLSFAAVLANAGTQLTFLSDSESLPLAGRLAAAYQPTAHWNLAVEGVFPQTGLASGHVGVEWRPIEMIALRGGYRTDTTKELSATTGFTGGMGLTLWGQEFSYAWVPFGDLGNAQYFSFLMRFGEAAGKKRNLIQFQNIKPHHFVSGPSVPYAYSEESVPDVQQLMELMDEPNKQPTAQAGPNAQ